MNLSISTLSTGATEALSGKRHRLKRSILSLALASFLGVTLFAGFGSAGTAFADTKVDESYDPDTGIVIEYYKNDRGDIWCWIIYPDGEIEIRTFDDNPNPEDDGRGAVYTPENVRDFLTQFGEATDPPQDKWDNPLGVQLTQQGQGLIPAHNPADVLTKTFDDGSGLGGNSPIDPNGGDYTQQLKKNGTGGNDSDGDDSDDPDRGEAGLFDADMPGPPPLVNPAPIGGKIAR